jgi:hypothetical protein
MTPSVAKNIAWRSRGITCVENRLRCETELRRDMLFDRWRDVGEGTDRARNRARRDAVARSNQALPIARELRIGLGELHAERRRLGVDSVAAADRGRRLVLERAALQRFEQRLDVLDQQVGRLLELHRERRVEHVGAGHSLVQPAFLRPELLARPGQEGDHVMPGDGFDRVDRSNVDLAQSVAVVSGANGFRVVRRDHPDLAHRLGREDLDLPPDAIAVLGRPDRGHLGARIAGDHAARG